MNIKDLAARTGYAVGTVSRALNNQPNVSEKARSAILSAAEECGFQLNANAKQLKQQHSNTILVIVKGTGNELFGEMIETIQNQVAQTSYQLAVDYLDEERNEVRRALRLCREVKPLGILFLGGNQKNFTDGFSSIGVPCVLVTGDASALDFDQLSSVTTNDREAARQAVEALISLGHKKIAVIGGDRTVSDTSRLRYEGCLQSFREHGLEFDPEQDYRSIRYSYQDGYQATRALLAEGLPYTAIFACADVMAIGAIRALWEAGLRVPEDVSVMGMDGLSLGSFLVPQLSTVNQSTEALAEHSVAILRSAIEDKQSAVHDTVPFQVCLRESVRGITETI